MIRREDLPEHPVSALHLMWQQGWIPRPVYAGGLKGDEYALVAEVEGYGFELAVGKDRSEAKREASEKLLDRILSTMCPTPRKKRYATWERGYEDMERLQLTGPYQPKQVYSCRCGWWHLSTQEPWDEGESA
jgi:hypothetical protein